MPSKVYTCESCKFIFTRVGECNQCPDCGKITVRPAYAKEIKELEDRLKHPEYSDYQMGKREQ